MNADQPLDRVATEWLAKLPASKEAGQAVGFDGRAWLSDWLEALARDKANEVFLGLDAFVETRRPTLADLDEHIMERGFALMEAWCVTMVTYGAFSEPWVKAAAERAVLAYRDRIEQLLTTTGDGGRA